MRASLESLANKKNIIGAEVGVLKGDHAKELLETYNFQKLYLIDCYISFRSKIKKRGRQRSMGIGTDEKYTEILAEAMANLRPFYKQFIMIIGSSWEDAHLIPDNSLDFVYIDGDHSYRGCLEDIRCYYPKVKPGGLVAGHDFGKPANGVEDAVKQYFGEEFSKVKKMKFSDWAYVKDKLEIK